MGRGRSVVGAMVDVVLSSWVCTGIGVEHFREMRLHLVCVLLAVVFVSAAAQLRAIPRDAREVDL
eukprot:141758-Rhodomonas_salina.1